MKRDEAAIFLQGATSLTVDVASWRNLAAALSGHKQLTKIENFELSDSPPAKKSPDHYKDVGGGYSVGEYEIALIGQ